MIRRLILAFALASLTTGASPPAEMKVEDAWSRPVAPGLATGVAYLTLGNGGSGPDRLIAASSPKAGRVTLHRSAMTRGVMTMEAVPGGLELPPGRTVALAPGGYHLMLEGLRGSLRPGERYRLTLRFLHAPSKTVEVVVRSASEPMAAMSMR